MKLANRLKLYRLQNGDLTQQDLADMIGCSRQTINSIEAGKLNPSVEIALKLSQALKAPMDDLFQLEEGEEKETFCQRLTQFFSCRKK